jgi:hypothetical protein
MPPAHRLLMPAPQSPRGTQPPNCKLPGSRRIDFAFCFLFGQDVQGDLLAFGAG